MHPQLFATFHNGHAIARGRHAWCACAARNKACSQGRRAPFSGCLLSAGVPPALEGVHWIGLIPSHHLNHIISVARGASQDLGGGGRANNSYTSRLFLSLLRNRKLINVLLVFVIYVARKGHRPYQLVFQLILFQWSKRESGNFRTRGIFFQTHSSCKSKGQQFTFVSSVPSRFGVE